MLKVSSSIANKGNKEFFLTGIANLELKNYQDASRDFKSILAKTSEGMDQQFHDQAEFYLALTHLAAGEKDLALPIFNSISADPDHEYHERVRKMKLDLRILDMK